MTNRFAFAFCLAAFLAVGSAAGASNVKHMFSQETPQAVVRELNELQTATGDFSIPGVFASGATVFISNVDGRVYGQATLSDGSEWTIRTVGKEVHVDSAQEIDCAFNDDGAGYLPNKAINLAPPAVAEVVDVLILVTSAKLAVESLSDIRVRVRAEFDYLNTAMLNSGRAVRFNPVAVVPVSYQETQNSGDALVWMSTGAETRQLREQYGADLISMDVKNGIPQAILGPVFNGAYSVLASGNYPPNLALRAHEIGHNLGLRHNTEQDPTPGPEHGSWWCNPAGTSCYKDVMAYGGDYCPLICASSARFSNPGVTFDGAATGTPGVSEAALIGAANALEIAGYMDKTMPSVCVPDEDTMCLLDGRFSVEVGWQTPDHSTGVGFVSGGAADTNQSGRFWFFQEANVELIIKMVDACSFNQRFWVFLAGLTNVGVTVVVTDNETGVSKFYYNDVNRAFGPQQDTDAFATCDI